MRFHLVPNDINHLTLGEFEVYNGALDAMIEQEQKQRSKEPGQPARKR